MSFLSDKEYSCFLESLLESDESFSFATRERIEGILVDMQSQISALEKEMCKIGRLIDLDNIKRELPSCAREKINQFFLEDEQLLKESEQSFERILVNGRNFFGYPMNSVADTYLIKYLKSLESKLPLTNNCGDPYELGTHKTNTKFMEKKMIKLFAENYGFTGEDDYWGYVSSGGTESNFWAIREGFLRYPNGKLYFSRGAHYSVDKFCSMLDKESYQKVDINADDTINVEQLFDLIRKNGDAPAIVLLTFGTTRYGTMDDFKRVKEFLVENNIEHYIHMDAALYGGIPQNQRNAPVLPSFKESGIDSISISLHKYLGSSNVNGILLAKSKGEKKVIDYIDQTDSTFLGSRSFAAFSTYSKCINILKRSGEGAFEKNILLTKTLFEKNGISFELNGNTFVIDMPSEEICFKYQLANFEVFEGGKKVPKSHILIFQYHDPKKINELAQDLALDLKKKAGANEK